MRIQAVIVTMILPIKGKIGHDNSKMDNIKAKKLSITTMISMKFYTQYNHVRKKKHQNHET